MKRRLADFAQDYDTLLEMQRLSWEINFPGKKFYEIRFRISLQSAIKREDVFVYEQDGAIVGWLWLDFTPFRSVHIRHIQVAQPFWGQKFGRAIVEDAITMCRERGCEAITLNVTKANTRAVSLYTHMGFVLTEDNMERQAMRLDVSRYRPNGQKG